jgi:hypothetical protein
MTERQLQWVALAALGCIRLGAVPSDDASIVGREAVDLIRIEWRFTLPGAGIVEPLAPASSQDEPLKPTPSGCDDRHAGE